MFTRKVKSSRTLTGVGAVMSVAHRDKTTNKIHGHTFEVIAWFDYDGTDFAVHKYRLDQVVNRLDHSLLPDEIAWGESLARYIAREINRGCAEYPALYDCVAVDVNRPLERIYARWER